MPRPESIRKGPPAPPLLQRIRLRAQRLLDEHRLLRDKRRYRRGMPTVDAPLVAFVVGCQRSGTNMLNRTLDRSLEVDRFDEDDPRAFDLCRVKGREVRDALVNASDARCVLFKPICDSHRLLELFDEHPGSKAIWIYRHYLGVAKSAVEYWGDTTKRYIEDLLAGGGDWGAYQWNSEGVSAATLETIREAAAGGISDYDACVLFWYLRNQTYFDQQLPDNPRVMLVKYEEMVTQPQREFARACAFLGVRFAAASVSRIHTGSVARGGKIEITPRVIHLADEMMSRLDAALARQCSGAAE